MQTRNFTTALTALAVAAALTACGGGGGSTDSGGTGSTTSSVDSTGTITGFGSVIVNGQRFETTGATVRFEDRGRVSEDELRLGMKVRVDGTIENGNRTANSIEFDDDLKGLVSSVSVDQDPDGQPLDTGTFNLFNDGLTVTVDGNTVFDDSIGNNIQDLAEDTRVEVSGFPTADGFLATRVESNAPDDAELELKGRVGAVDLNAGTITVSGIQFEGISSGILQDGLLFNDELIGTFVEVKANGEQQPFTATEVQAEDDLVDDEQEDEFEIEGVLQSVDTTTNPDQIVINGRTLQVQNASRLGDFVNKRVEIKGDFIGNGVLVLRTEDGVRTEVENNVRTEDVIVSTDPGLSTLTTRLGLVIEPQARSRIENDDLDDGDNLSVGEFISSLATGTGTPLEVEARGFSQGDSITWTRIEAESEDDANIGCSLRGTAENVDQTNSTFEIQGVTVNAQSATEFPETTPGLTAFLETIAATTRVVEAETDSGSACNTGQLDAQELEFEDDDGVFGTVPPGAGADDRGDDNGQDDDDRPGRGDDQPDSEITGAVTSTSANSFIVSGRTISVTNSTTIDDSLIEAARGAEVDDDADFGTLDETLSALLDGKVVEVRVQNPGAAGTSGDPLTAVTIEDSD